MSFKKEEVDEVFETYLKPMNSRNARLLFKILYDYRLNFLTTLDIQNILKNYNLHLNKIELNNWLTTLMISGLIKKSENRGKPTIITYDNKYTYTLWKISSKGIEIGELIPLLIYTVKSERNIDKYSNFNDYKNKSLKLLTSHKVIDYLNKNDGEVTFSQLKDNLSYSNQDLILHFKKENRVNEKELFSFKLEKETLFDRILNFIGVNIRKKMRLVLN
jgi:hypothetical protein